MRGTPESIERALDQAKGRGDIVAWTKNYIIEPCLEPAQIFTLKEARAFLIGLVTGKTKIGDFQHE